MASYRPPPAFFGHPQPEPQFPPQPAPGPQQEDFSSLPYYDPAFAGFGNPYDIPGAAAAGAPLPQDHPPGLADGTNSRGGRGSSEEKELTPGQRRRKEQNRAAQRAFRERKEKHVKELESRLASLEQANSRAAAENDKLKEQLEKTRLENRLLHENTLRGHSSPEPLPEVGPMGFNPFESNPPGAGAAAAANGSGSSSSEPPAKFINPLFTEHPNRGSIHRISTSPGTGERLLGAGAAWDLIICHPLYEQGLVDIGDISGRLKSMARCDGQGPVFEESIVLEAIQQSVGSGRDELLVEETSCV